MIYWEEEIKVNNHSAALFCYVPSEPPFSGYGKKRPAVLILPGGGYKFTYEGEAEPVALKLCAAGICTFVLHYATKPSKEVFPVALCETLLAIKYIRENSEKYGVNENNISVLGFSAGGHLCASAGTMFEDSALGGYLDGEREIYRANKMVLCYPVITADEKYAHKGSFESLTGKNFTEITENERDMLSAEKRVTRKTPPAFIWTTAEDGGVPPQNSLLMAKALSDKGIPFELYVYPHGDHGLCTADHTSLKRNYNDTLECSEWIEKAVRFIYDEKIKLK